MPKTYLTPEEYLEIERKAEFKSEYFQGEMFAMAGAFGMAGAREPHNLIVLNLAGLLYQHLRQRPCRAYVADMRVRLSATGLYTYPDVTVVCGEPLFLDDTRDTLINPNVIIEVLSPSTEAYDRGRKFEHYRSVASVSEYLMIASDRISVELFTRQPGGWLLTAAGQLEDSIELASIACSLKLADLYEKVDFSVQ